MSIATHAKAVENPDGLALVDERVEITWSQLDETLNRLGNAVLETVMPGERATVFAENSTETLIAHLGCIAVGVSTVPASFHLTPVELSHIITASGSTLVFAGPETWERAIEAAGISGSCKVVAWRSPDAAGTTPWDEWLGKASADEPPADMAPRPFLHFTSGTTGVPKGAETPPAMFAGGETVMEHFDKVRATNFTMSPALVVSPLYHTGPLTMVRGVAAGATVVILGRFDAEKALAAIERHKVASSVMVPTHFVRFLSVPEERRAMFDLSSLMMVAHTGSACPVDVKRKMIEWWGPVFVEAYGATESGTTNMITSHEWLERPGSVGRTLAPFEVKVVGEDGGELSAGEVGILYFHDTSGRGIVYHDDPEKTAAAHRAPGEFTLGEMGYVDEDGYVFITDRVTDMVVSGGVNIYPAEAENVLMELPGIADVACIGVPDDDMGEALKALVVVSPGEAHPDSDEIIAFCRSRLAGYKCPRSVEFVVDLGRTSMGKVNKRALRAPFWPTERTIG